MGKIVSTVSFEDQTKTNGYRRDVHFRLGDEVAVMYDVRFWKGRMGMM